VAVEQQRRRSKIAGLGGSGNSEMQRHNAFALDNGKHQESECPFTTLEIGRAEG
jgi:hypothetical protein